MSENKDLEVTKETAAKPQADAAAPIAAAEKPVAQPAAEGAAETAAEKPKAKKSGKSKTEAAAPVTEDTSDVAASVDTAADGTVGGAKQKRSLGKLIGSFFHAIKYYWKRPMGADRHLSLREMAAYGVGGMGCNFILNVTILIVSATLIPRYYEIGAIHGTLIVAIASFLQIFLCPLIGNWIDNTKTKLGKYKPWFLFLTPIFTLFVVLASWIPQFSSAGENAVLFRTIFAYCSCIPSFFLLGIYQNLHQAYPLLMTPNSQERADMMGPTTLIYSLAPSIMNALLPGLRGIFIKMGKEYLAYRIFGLVFALLGCAMVTLIIFFTKERVYVTKKQEKMPFFKGLKLISKNKPFILYLIFLAFSILKVVAFNFMAIMAEYKFNADPAKALALLSPLSMVMGFGATPAMILAPLIIRKVSKKTLLICAHLLQAIVLFALVVAGFERFPQGVASVVILTAYGFFFQFGNGLSLVVMPTLVAETVDYQQFLTDDRMEGFMNNLTVLASQGIGNLLVVGVTLLQTMVIGFDQGKDYFIPASPSFGGAEATAIANKWFNVACIISFVSLIICVIPLFFYKFSEQKHKDIMEVIKNRAIGSTFEDEETLIHTKTAEEVAAEAAAIQKSLD